VDCVGLELVALSKALAFGIMYNSNTVECCILSRNKSTTAPKIATIHVKKMLPQLISGKGSQKKI
jgi:hypothetical protein